MSLTFEPDTLEYSTLTNEILQFDLSEAVTSLGGTSAASLVAVLTDLATGLPVDLGVSPTLSGSTTALLQVDGSLLSVGQRYQLVIEFTAAPTSNRTALRLGITAAF